VPGDAAALDRRRDGYVDRLGQTGGNHRIKLVGALVQDPHGEMIEVQKIVRKAYDLLLQHAQPLARVQLPERLRVQAHHLAAGRVDRVDLLAQPVRRGDIQRQAHDLGDLVLSRQQW
jgi:hypothetical protein